MVSLESVLSHKKILIAIVATFDMMLCSTATLPAQNLAALGHPRSCSIALSRAILLRSAHMLLWYRSQVFWATTRSSLLYCQHLIRYGARLRRCLLTIWPRWVILEAVASLWVDPFSCAVLICFYGIAAKCFEPFIDLNCYTVNIEHDTLRCLAVGLPR